MSDRRSLILRVAEKLLCHYGVRKTTVHDIAQAAEIGVGTIYIEFSSKDAILEELARKYHGNVLERMQSAAAEHRDFERRFRAVMNARIECFLEVSNIGEHAAELMHCAECEAVVTAFDEFRGRQRDFLAEMLDEATRSGKADIEDPRVTAETLLRAYSSFSPPEIYQLDDEEVQTLCAVLHRIALRGLVGEK